MNIQIINNTVWELQNLRHRLQERLPKYDRYLAVDLELGGIDGDPVLRIYHAAGVRYDGPIVGAETAFIKILEQNPAQTIKMQIAALEYELAKLREKLSEEPAEAT